MIFKFRNSFKQQLESFRPAMYRLAWSWCHDVDLADDLVQEAYAKALKNRAQLENIEKLKPWLTRILVNKHTDYLRCCKNQIELEEQHLTDNEDPRALLDRADTIQQVRDAIEKLSDDHRKIITLVDLAELSYAEVAEILQIPVGTVMSRLNRARQQLKALLQPAQQEEKFPALRRVK